MDPEPAKPEKLKGSGSLTQRPWPKLRTISGISGMGCPWVTTRVRLRAIISVPSVTMKDGILAFVTTSPANSPNSGPTNNGTSRPSAMIHQTWSAALATGIQRTMIQPATAADRADH
jgi:hypothetical protein